MCTVRIMIADDHAIVRRGLRALVESQQGWEVCAEAANGRDAVGSVEQFKPDIAIVDIGMPELNGLEATRQILKSSPQTEVLILTMHQSEEVVAEVLKAGARGYVLKSDADQNLIAAVEAMIQHKPFLTSGVTDVVLSEFLSSRTAPLDMPPGRNVTPREREIIQLLAEGKSNKDIANMLSLSLYTVETHRSNILRKLNLHTVPDLILYAVRKGVIS